MSIKKENEAWTSAIISKSKKLTGGDKPRPQGFKGLFKSQDDFRRKPQLLMVFS